MMKIHSIKNAGLITACILTVVSCINDPQIVLEEPFGFEQPDHFPASTYTFELNPVTKSGFELGKKLFLDPILSRNNAIACSECHIQNFAFADKKEHAVSIGINNRLGKRNAQPIQNLAFMSEFFWDGGVTHLDFVPLNAIEADFEMDEEIANVIRKLNEDAMYLQAFEKAFGQDSITSPYLFYALSQFMNMMVSGNSKYDQYIQGKASFTQTEKDGLELFKQNCAECHSGTLFTDQDYHNNGLSTTFETDSGRARITENTNDIGKFKTPSLRNIEKTAPYMHNGAIKTLEEVLQHYASNVKSSNTLAQQLNNNGNLGISLSVTDQEKIIVFLKTLTDDEFLNNPLFFNQN